MGKERQLHEVDWDTFDHKKHRISYSHRSHTLRVWPVGPNEWDNGVEFKIPIAVAHAIAQEALDYDPMWDSD